MGHLSWKYLEVGVVLAVIVFAVSLWAFPALGQSVAALLALAALVATQVVGFLANLRKAFEAPAAPPSAGAPTGDVVLEDKSSDQAAQGSYIAQAAPGGTATVNVTHIEPAPQVLPPLHQLRAPVADFTGRAEEMAKLISALQPGQAAALCSIGGMGGVGKTELAYVVGNQLKERFPDAQIVVDMRGTS